MSALAPHHPPRLSDRDFATQVEDTLQSCTEAKRVRWWVHYKKLAPLLPDTVTEQMLKTYASADTPKMGSFAERGVLVCTPHRQPYFYVFERGEEIPSYVNQDYQKQRTVVALFEQYYEKNFELLVDELLRAARDRTETTARLAVSVLGLDEATCSGTRRTAIRAISERWQTVRAFAETESLATPMRDGAGPAAATNAKKPKLPRPETPLEQEQRLRRADAEAHAAELARCEEEKRKLEVNHAAALKVVNDQLTLERARLKAAHDALERSRRRGRAPSYTDERGGAPADDDEGEFVLDFMDGAGDAGNFVVDWDDGSECQRDVPAADFRKNVRLSYYKHA